MKKSTNPLWGGRFKTGSSELLKNINNSISFDHQLAFQDIKLNKAYAETLLKAKIISKMEFNIILNGLDEIFDEIKKGKFKFDELYEDIHMNIEMSLRKKIGDVAGKIHTGKSRNDQERTFY